MPMSFEKRSRSLVAGVLLALGACAAGPPKIAVVAGSATRKGLKVKCEGDWRTEGERDFLLRVTADCSTSAPLRVNLYDELNNPLTEPCHAPPPTKEHARDPQTISLIAGREERVYVCRTLPRRSMQVAIEVQAGCRPPPTASMSGRTECLVD
jgi:hypothetical protein